MVTIYKFILDQTETLRQVNGVSHRATVKYGGLLLEIDTMDGSPIDWTTVMYFAEKMLAAVRRGMTMHYALVLTHRTTRVGMMISLSFVGAGLVLGVPP